MPIHLRQICLVAHELAPNQQNIEAVFQVPVCHRDPEVATFGLQNALFAFGTQFLEVVAPTRDGTAAGRFLERQGGDGGYMVICQIHTLEEQAALRQRAADNQVRVAYESDRGSWNIMQLHPRDMEAAFLEVDWDEQADMQGNWQAAGGLTWTGDVRQEAVRGITGVTLAGSDPQGLAAHWARVIGQPVTTDNGLPAVLLANAVLRFTRGDTPHEQGLVGLDVSVPAPEETINRARDRGLPTSQDGFRLGGVDIRCRPSD